VSTKTEFFRPTIFLARLFAVYRRWRDFDRTIAELYNEVYLMVLQMIHGPIDDVTRDEVANNTVRDLMNEADLTRSEGEVKTFARILITRGLYRGRRTEARTLAIVARTSEESCVDEAGDEAAATELLDGLDVGRVRLLCTTLARSDGLSFALLRDRIDGATNPEIAAARGLTVNAVKSAVSRAQAVVRAWCKMEDEIGIAELPNLLGSDGLLLELQVIEGHDDELIGIRLDLSASQVRAQRHRAWIRLIAWARAD
jgi:DNA-directed RNA polymerase specialized sigma24 family protein